MIFCAALNLLHQGSTMSPKKSPPPNVSNLALVSAKFLYFMSFLKSASAETVRAYRLDLSQAFKVSKDEIFRHEKSRRIAEPVRGTELPDERQLLDLCRGAMRRWVSLGPASRNRKVACLKSFLSWLHEQGRIDRDLASQLHGPNVPHRLPRHLSVDEAMSLLKFLDEQIKTASTEKMKHSSLRDLALILLLYGGGLRVSEACTMEWKRIDVDQRVMRVRGKGGKERIVALPAFVLTALQRLPRQRQDPYVFGEAPLSTRLAYEIVKTSALKARLLTPLHPHALRHSYATHLLASGASLRTLQELLGHESLQATQRYTHVGIDQLARTMERFHPLSNKKT